MIQIFNSKSNHLEEASSKSRFFLIMMAFIGLDRFYAGRKIFGFLKILAFIATLAVIVALTFIYQDNLEFISQTNFYICLPVAFWWWIDILIAVSGRQKDKYKLRIFKWYKK
ncbi:hypothetical protein ACW95P_04865 [Candidatus Mycoplasma pogonae]